MFKRKRQPLPKDLVNDLVRAENIKARIMEQVKKPVDQPMRETVPGEFYASSDPLVSTAMSFTAATNSIYERTRHMQRMQQDVERQMRKELNHSLFGNRDEETSDDNERR